MREQGPLARRLVRWLPIAMACAGAAALVLAARAPRGPAADAIFGFHEPRALERQHAFEARFLELVSADRIEEWHAELTAEPHPAGSARNLELAAWMAERWRAFGFDEVRIVEDRMRLPEPAEIVVDLVAPRPWRMVLTEPPIEADPSGRIDPGTAFHAYSASGEVTAEVVYAGVGGPEQYEWLAARGIDVAGRIVLVRHARPHMHRSSQAWTAAQRGAAGILMFSDPAAAGEMRGPAYPAGPWAPAGAIERGSILYAFLAPGDPWRTAPGPAPEAGRGAVPGVPTLPSIPSVPIAWRDARVILEALGGPEAPPEWPVADAGRRVGPGPSAVSMRVRMEDEVRPVATVLGTIRGRRDPDRFVMLGNHRDAWTFGGLDPSSGSSALMEVARALGQLRAEGFRPARSIVLASWDAEELGLLASTAWVEARGARLGDEAVAYLNVDSAGTGSLFGAVAVPSLNRLLLETAARVPHPETRRPLIARWRDETLAALGRAPAAIDEHLVANRIGLGSDYAPFLFHAGVPVADLGFRGPYGVYHSAYDTHAWVRSFGDPGFRNQETVAALWGIAATRLANADVLPLDHVATAARLRGFVEEALREGRLSPHEVAAVREPLDRFAAAARRLAQDRGEGRLPPGVDAALMAVGPAFIDPEGLPGRPWYRHLIYAPAFTHAPIVLPGLTGESAGRSPGESARLAAALDRAAAALERPFVPEERSTVR